MRVARLLVELGLLGALAALALAEPPQPWRLQALCAGLALAALALPARSWTLPLAAALWLSGLRLAPGLGLTGLWPLGPGAFLVAGAALGCALRRGAGTAGQEGWARELALAGGLALLAALFSAGAAWALLALRSGVRMSPGSAAWVFPGIAALAAALGWWATRELGPPPTGPRRGPLAWIAAHRLPLALLSAIAWDTLRLAVLTLSE